MLYRYRTLSAPPPTGFWRLLKPGLSPSFPQQGRFMETIQAHAPPAGDPRSQPPKKQNNKPPGGFKRKRTGCMTCRGRKIKCCERKPTCSNCEKAKRECVWVGGGDIFKHDQNPSVAEKRETKFYRGSASSWKAEDQQRLTTASAINREFQFVSMNNDAREQPLIPQPYLPPPPNMAAAQSSPYQHMDLQALASAATYMPLPPTTYGESESQGADAMIDPNLDGATANNTGQSTFQGTTESTDHQARDVEEIETVVARALTAVGESDLQRASEATNKALSGLKND